MAKRHPAKISMDIYDADGELCESIGGQMDYEDVREQMLAALKNDGIPVIRRHAKHEAGGLPEGEPMGGRRGEHCSPAHATFEQPMTISIKFDNVQFVASGKYDDVMDAQAEFLAAIFEE